MTEPTQAAALLQDWRAHYGDVPPVAHVLRQQLRSRWFRIHSLPGGKRYATTEPERLELLRRQNELISVVLGNGARAWLVFGYFGEEAQLPEEVASVLRAMAPAFLTSVGPRDAGTVETYPLMAAMLTWAPQAIDPILEAVADDQLETPLLVSADLLRVVAPYDGGVDVIVESTERRSDLARRFKDWS